MSVWRWAAASEIGTSHLRLKTRKQDAMACFRAQNGNALCAIVCDGAGSAELGGEGASIICRILSTALRAHFRDNVEMPHEELIRSWVDEARDRLSFAASRREKSRRAFASTLVMLMVTRDGVLTVHVGDGAIVARDGNDQWQVLSSPAHGEYASSTFFLTDDPAPQLRIAQFSDAYSAFAVFSDGIENLVLDHQTSAPHAPFFRSMLAPLESATELGKNRKLSAALSEFLSSPRVCDKTDDDKTLLLISSK